METKIKTVKGALETLIVFRSLLADPVIDKYYLLLQSLTGEITVNSFLSRYSDFFAALLAKEKVSLPDYLSEKIIYTETAFSRFCAAKSLQEISPELYRAVAFDLAGLQKAAALTPQEIKEYAINAGNFTAEEESLVRKLPEWSMKTAAPAQPALKQNFTVNTVWENQLEALAAFYQHHGSGVFARYQGFLWEREEGKGRLVGIEYPDPIRLQDLIGYEKPRQVVIDNTLKFIEGYTANNVLLYGDRGTGKSSTVKALLSEYAHLGLRIIELPQPYLADLPQLLRQIKNKPQKFIIFIDDLAFADTEETYTPLKAVLEGGLESRPRNVVIYATSNRRHLIKERFSERAGLYADNKDDEVRAAETIQEKLSLADRFGITVTFLTPNQEKYLEIVEGLAAQRGLNIEKELLYREALRWELKQNGRSPRTARQFIDWLEANLAHVQKKSS